MIIDGSYGEGGGQILRTAVALSVLTQKSIKVINIRKNRKPPGLKQQHLVSLRTLAKISESKLSGDKLGSTAIEFVPGKLKPGKYSIDIGTAGSITLLLQTLIPAIVVSGGEYKLYIKGGTNVPWSPSFEYFRDVFTWFMKYWNVTIEANLLRKGYYPKGGGEVEVNIFSPYSGLESIKRKPLILEKLGELKSVYGYSNASTSLKSRKVAERQEKAIMEIIPDADIITEYWDTYSPGSDVCLVKEYTNTIIGADIVGEIHKSAERVGREVAESLQRENSPVDRHMADQLIPFLAIFGGKFITSKITNHVLTNIHVTESMLGIKFHVEGKGVVV